MKNFLLYLGGVRCGSTWLYHQLNSRSDCDMGPIKEWFLFNEKVNLPIHSTIGREKYFEFYNERSLQTNTKLLGDITPSNGGASQQQLEWYKHEMESKNFNVLPFLTLRDPIDQMVSYHIFFERIKNTEMTYSNLETLTYVSLKESETQHNFSVQDVVDRFKSYEFFSYDFVDTETLINNTEKLFDNVHVNFYETMFTNNSMTSLCKYLEIPYQPFDIDTKVWSFGKSSLSDDEKKYLYESFPVLHSKYDYAVNQFGKDFIQNIWWNPYK